jgi:hypothetical protein
MVLFVNCECYIAEVSSYGSETEIDLRHGESKFANGTEGTSSAAKVKYDVRKKPL